MAQKISRFRSQMECLLPEKFLGLSWLVVPAFVSKLNNNHMYAQRLFNRVHKKTRAPALISTLFSLHSNYLLISQRLRPSRYGGRDQATFFGSIDPTTLSLASAPFWMQMKADPLRLRSPSESLALSVVVVHELGAFFLFFFFSS